jgi:hypothetical protein
MVSRGIGLTGIAGIFDMFVLLMIIPLRVGLRI